MKIMLNEDKEVVRAVRKGLIQTGGYCPCMRVRSEATKCMCSDFKQKVSDPDFEGYCRCLMYYKKR